MSEGWRVLSIEHQIRLAQGHVVDALLRRPAIQQAISAWEPFHQRLEQHFPALLTELSALYGERADFLDFVESLLATAFDAWAQRPEELKALDLAREKDPTWFQSQEMLGGVCYVDKFAGSLQGIEAQIPYFQELGLTL